MALFCCCSIWSRIWCWHSIIWFPYGHLLVSTLRPIDPHFSLHMSYLCRSTPTPIHSKLYLNEHWVHTLILDNVKIVAGQFSKPNFHSSSSIKVKSYHKMHLNEGRLWPGEVSQSWSKTKLCQASAMPIFPSFCFYKWAVSPQKKITNMNILLWVTLLKGKFQAKLKFLEMAK